MSYHPDMTLTHQTVLGEDGKPTAAIIPWDVFVEIREAHSLDLSPEESAELREARADAEAGNSEAFVSADDV